MNYARGHIVASPGHEYFNKLIDNNPSFRNTNNHQPSARPPFVRESDVAHNVAGKVGALPPHAHFPLGAHRIRQVQSYTDQFHRATGRAARPPERNVRGYRDV